MKEELPGVGPATPVYGTPPTAPATPVPATPTLGTPGATPLAGDTQIVNGGASVGHDMEPSVSPFVQSGLDALQQFAEDHMSQETKMMLAVFRSRVETPVEEGGITLSPAQNEALNLAVAAKAHPNDPVTISDAVRAELGIPSGMTVNGTDYIQRLIAHIAGNSA